jgi:hypothetical protein
VHILIKYEKNEKEKHERERKIERNRVKKYAKERKYKQKGWEKIQAKGVNIS